MGVINNSRRIVVVLGSTGTGKSKLAIEIAQRFRGEVINADSMQVYKGLDIITNKVKSTEQQGIPHHLLDFVDPTCNYTVTDFRNQAVPLIDKMLSNNILPVVVGGTNYYIESVLWQVLASNLENMTCIGGKGKQNISNSELMKYQDIFDSDASFHDKLKAIDPVMANKIHPNDHRKVFSSLMMPFRSGRLHSEIIQEQKQMDGGSTFGAPLRYPEACILWLDAERNTLDERLDQRVDDMLVQGLVEELLIFSRMSKSKSKESSDNVIPNYTHGIFQSIGLKEFDKYLALTNEQKDNDKNLSEKYLSEGVENLKLVTRRYARKQVSWIKNRFLKKSDRQVPPIYKLDSTDISKWTENIYNPAVEIVNAHMDGLKVPIDPVMREELPSNENITFHCEDCDQLILGEVAWNTHNNSRKHRKIVASNKKRHKVKTES